MSSKEFVFGHESKWDEMAPGVVRQILGYDNEILLANVKFEKGGIGAMHDHFHSQVSYVLEGSFEVTIGSETKVLKKGDSFYIPPNVSHGAVCLEAGALIDTFSPIREDFFEEKASGYEG